MSEEFANQSEVIEPTVEEPTNTEPEGESLPQEQPQGISVKYDKEEKFIPQEEIQNWVQKGLYYENKVQNKLQDYETKVGTLEKLAQLQGYQSTDDFLKAVQEYEKQQQLEQEAARLGMDVEQFQQYVNPINEELRGTKQQLEQMQSQLFSYQIERAENALKTQYPDFEQHREKVFNIAQELGLSPDKLDYAYKLATYDSKPAQVEQETIKKLQQNADSSPGSLSMGQDEKFTFSSLSPAEKSAFIERVKRGEITSF